MEKSLSSTMGARSETARETRSASVLKNIRLKLVYGAHLLVHNEVPPDDEEWAFNLSAILENKKEIKGIFVYTMGGGPNAVQRSSYNNALEKAGIKPKVAVLSGSAVVRGILTAFNWVQGGTMRLFPLDGVGPACDYLGLSGLEQTAVSTELQKFKSELGIERVLP
jgi:hypothetical protein